MNAMRLGLFLLASTVLAFGTGCGYHRALPAQATEFSFQPGPDFKPSQPLDLRILAVNENGIDLELRNKGKKDLYLFNKFDPAYGITSFEVRNGRHDDLGLKAGMADWLAQPKSLLILEPGQSMKHSLLRTSLWYNPKRTTFRVRYKVAADSFFLEPWHKGMLNKEAIGKDYEAKRWCMMQAWLGEAVSNEVSFDFSKWPKTNAEMGQPAE